MGDVMDNNSFHIFREDGKSIDCQIVSIINNPSDINNPYIIYTDDSKDTLLCGQLIEVCGVYTINNIKDNSVLEILKENLTNDILRLLDEFKVNADE